MTRARHPTQDERAKAILAGFKINWMNMSDAETGKMMWQDDNWEGGFGLLATREAHIPKDILKCRAVSREINFSSVELLNGLRLEQRVFFQGQCMEGE